MADIEAKSELDDDSKVEEGLLIKNVIIKKVSGLEVCCEFQENNTRLRQGDKIFLSNPETGEKIDATVIENQTSIMFIDCLKLPLQKEGYVIEVREFVMLDPIMDLLRRIEDGVGGSYFFDIIAGAEAPTDYYSDKDLNKVPGEFVKDLNDEQKDILSKIIKKPSLHCVQGPPGTGKTKLLAAAAAALSWEKNNILVIAKTHHAVNNALEKIAKVAPFACIAKIGPNLKANLNKGNIQRFKTIWEWSKINRKHNQFGKIIGMTIQSAIIYLGLNKSCFTPNIVLVDEASQIQLAEGALIGTFGAPSTVFIGDDKQMPPVFHPHQIDNPLSVSVFEHLIRLYPKQESHLSVTYRMNKTITEVISKYFYEPYGERLVSADVARDKVMKINSFSEDSRIKHILDSNKSIIMLDVNKHSDCKDENLDEAEFASRLIVDYIKAGGSSKQIAVITPFRKQALRIRELTLHKAQKDLPIIDTVERLQGSDVDFIILSMCSTYIPYIQDIFQFLFNHNRLNVMISRARTKVVILAAKYVQHELLNIRKH